MGFAACFGDASWAGRCMWQRWVIPRHHGDRSAYTAKRRPSPLVYSKEFFVYLQTSCHAAVLVLRALAVLISVGRTGYTGTRALWYWKCAITWWLLSELELSKDFGYWNFVLRHLGSFEEPELRHFKSIFTVSYYTVPQTGSPEISGNVCFELVSHDSRESEQGNWSSFDSNS